MNAITSLHAVGVLGALILSLLAGCSDLPCGGRGGPPVADMSDEPWASVAQRRAASAIDFDARGVISRLSTLAVSGTQVKTLHDRTRVLATLALDVLRASPVESSRLPLSFAHQQMYEIAAEAERAAASPHFRCG